MLSLSSLSHLKTERTEVGAAARIRTIEGIAARKVGERHFASWAAHGKDLLDYMLLSFEDLSALLLHFLDGAEREREG